MTDRGSGRFEELTTEECWKLLAGHRVGRIAWSGVRGLQVMPVNYTVVDQAILFRTSPTSGIAKALYEAEAAFQVDDVDEFLQSGWSVLVQGSTTYLDTPEDLPHDLSDRPEPWAPGVRQMYIRVDPQTITGRRVVGG